MAKQVPKPDFKKILQSNSNAMKHFYSLPPGERNVVLDNISRMNTEYEINEFLDDFSWERP